MIFKRKNNRVKFKRIFDEMAEFGLLEGMLKTRLKYFFQNSDEFKADMINLLYKKADKPSPLVEKIYLENLSNSLDDFLKRAGKWQKQKH